MIERENSGGAIGLAAERISTADLAGHTVTTLGENQSGEERPASVAERAKPDDRAEPLFPAQDATELRARWDAIQAGFVDEPRRAVEDADSLVAAAMKRLAGSFASERSALEAQWARGDDVSTEDLRVALRRYRSFFGRLLSM